MDKISRYFMFIVDTLLT